ncbi:signal peptide [Acinetobacter baumannii]|nr:signal peptide [Acinetobacter baumannii]
MKISQLFLGLVACSTAFAYAGIDGISSNERALLHKDLKCKAPLIEPNLRRNLGKWST